MNAPRAYLERMKERLEDFPAFLRAMEEPPVRGLRVNTLKLSAPDFIRISPFALEAVPWEKDGFYISAEKAGGDVYHFAGLYYLQEPSAMCAVPLFGSVAGELVLDLCAAPGGKTTQLAQAMQGEGVLVANEVEPARARALSQNVERLGVRNCAVVSAPPQRLAAAFPACFDAVLVDAPCSGEGMFRKDGEAAAHWSEANVAMCAARQSDILDCAAETVASGGRLVYSTCTFSREEDGEQIARFLCRHPEFSLAEEKTLFPHEARGEGHYAALLKKEGGVRRQVGRYAARHSRAAEAAFAAFARELFPASSFGEIETLADGRMYLVPGGMPALPARVIRLGVELGEWDGRRFKPAHALAMALGAEAKRKILLSRAEAERYLRGETLRAETEDGWCVVCADGFPVGFGKAVAGEVKNHLPKGLRMVRAGI